MQTHVPETAPEYPTDNQGSGYTVGQLIARLQGHPPDMPVGFNIGPGTDLCVLSIYATDPGTPGSRINGSETLWFDLGENDE